MENGWYISGRASPVGSESEMGNKTHAVSPRVRATLHEHQVRALGQMAVMEQGPMVQRRTTVQTRVGVLADPPGSGKTLTVLAHVASCPLPHTDFMCASTPHTTMGLTSIQVHDDQGPGRWTPIHCTLVVVPHYLEFQWMQDLKEHTDLRYTSVGRKHMQTDLLDLVNQFDIVLCKNTVYKPFAEEMLRQVPDGKWARVVVDEADSVRIPDGPVVLSDFYWLVTATPERMFRDTAKSNFVRDVSRQVPWDALFHMHLERCLWIHNACPMSGPTEASRVDWVRYHCIQPRDVHILQDLISEDAYTCLTADDRTGAAELMGQIVDESTLVATVAQKMRIDIEQTQLVLEGMQMQEPTPQVQTVVRNAETRMRDLLQKWETLEGRIRTRGDCPICYSEIQPHDPYVLYACCQNRTCTDCCAHLSKGLRLPEYGVRDAECPFCRTSLSSQSVIVAQNDDARRQRRTRSSLVSKQECLERLIRTRMPGRSEFRMLIFSESSGRWDRIAETLSRMNVDYETLRGGATQVERIVRRFREGQVRVLLLNTLDIGSGLNLQCATDLVLYHEPSTDDLRTQVVGRADRPGRTHPLHVHLLTYGETV